jgi:hypothetical protein
MNSASTAPTISRNCRLTSPLSVTVRRMPEHHGIGLVAPAWHVCMDSTRFPRSVWRLSHCASGPDREPTHEHREPAPCDKAGSQPKLVAHSDFTKRWAASL